MRTLGVYLIFAAIALRGIVMALGEPYFMAVLMLLAAYGLLLAAKTWIVPRTSPGWVQSRTLASIYLLLQSALVLALTWASRYEDFYASLMIPLSLDAVSFFGRRSGFLWISAFSLMIAGPLFFAEEGPMYAVAMSVLNGGICFLFGGYAGQVLQAEAAHEQNKRMLTELQSTHRQLQGYADQLVNLTVEQERNRLARELHDSVTQTVFSMNLTAQSARLLWGKEPPRVAEQLLHLEELSANALAEIQSLVSQLKPRSVSEEGLPTALRRLVEERRSRDGLQVTLEIRGERALSEAETRGLYSIAQEALTNVAKHSGAQQATVRLNLDPAGPCLEIEDHGRGFLVQTAGSQPGHLGLAEMSERAREIGWSLCIDSHPYQGTWIQVLQNPTGGPA